MAFNNSNSECIFRLDFADTPLAAATELLPLLSGGGGSVREYGAQFTVAPRSVAVFEVR